MKKRLFFILLIGFCLTSCTQSPEEKANTIIEQYIKNNLYKPDTYEKVTTQVDSAFTPFCDPNFHKTLLTLQEVSEDIEEYENKIDSKKDEMSDDQSYMSLYDTPYSTSYKRNQYQRYKEDYEEHKQELQKLIEKKEDLIKKTEQIRNEIQSMLSIKPQFIGFQAFHRYRADNNVGQILMKDFYFIFDQNFTQILVVYDTDGRKFKTIEEMIKILKDEK